MYICPKCGNKSDVPVRYCSNCGEPMIEQQQSFDAPPVNAGQQLYNQQYGQQQYNYDNQYQMYNQYRQYAPPRKPSIAKAIVGMIMSIEGFSVSVIGTLFTLIFSCAGLAGPDIGWVFSIYGLVYGLVFLACSLPFAIVGFVLSNKSIKEGCISRMNSVGKKLGLTGIILGGVLLGLSLISLFIFVFSVMMY